MRRAVIATGVTIAGVAWLLAYKVPPHQVQLAAGDAGGTQPAAPNPSPAPSSQAAADGTFTGQPVDVRYGYVQVRVIVSGGRIADIQPLQLPSDRARSAYISQYSAPVLRSEAIQAQSARIDVVSGATYTSAGYAQSLESALQQDHLG